MDLILSDPKPGLDIIRQSEVFRLGRVGTGRLPFPRLPIAADEVAIENAAHFPTGRDFHFRADRLPRRGRTARLLPAGDRRAGRLPAEGEVLLKLIARHEERGADRVERPAPLVIGQAAHIDINIEPRLERVFVFAAVKPAECGDPALVADRLAGRGQSLRERGEKLRLGCGFGLRLVFRRHLTGVEHVEHLLPPLGGLDGGNRGRQVVEPHGCIFDALGMAFETVCCEQAMVERGRGRWGRSGGMGQRRGGQDDHDACRKAVTMHGWLDENTIHRALSAGGTSTLTLKSSITAWLTPGSRLDMKV